MDSLFVLKSCMWRILSDQEYLCGICNNFSQQRDLIYEFLLARIKKSLIPHEAIVKKSDIFFQFYS